jgi:anaerobic selenocysteine-containing dehydrogenase
MERRKFLKISAVSGAAAALDACGKPERQLVRFIPEENLVPGVAVWRPSICTLCSAGCGTMVRIMEGDAEVVRHGETGLIKMGLAKKLEGNPHHPISQGKLCARGQAGLQVTYHPDRIQHPLKRIGPRGSGQFQEVSWNDAIKDLTSRLAPLRSAKDGSGLTCITRPLSGVLRHLMYMFAGRFGGPDPIDFEFFDKSVLRRANELVFGTRQLPTFDLALSNYVVSFGADFLGTWNSPVAQSVAYGEMRQGRAGNRGKFVMIEPRMSQTGANADEWIPARPGSEGFLALGIARVMIEEKLRPASGAAVAGRLLPGWSAGLVEYTPEKTEARTGVAAEQVRKLAREMASQGPAVAIIGGGPLAQANGLFNAIAVNCLNLLLGSFGKPGGIGFGNWYDGLRLSRSAITSGMFSAMQSMTENILENRPNAPKAVLLYDANPVFAVPTAVPVREALEKVPFIVSFGSFIDETSALADLILPDHSPLESWLMDCPESGALGSVVSVSAPVMKPLHNTRAIGDVLIQVVRSCSGEISDGNTFEEELRLTCLELLENPLPEKLAASPKATEFWEKMKQQGGLWNAAILPPIASPNKTQPAFGTEPAFDGPESDFPFHFLPFPSEMLFDGSVAHLPWLQEAPDPISTAMWGTWVEINPQTAKRLGIEQGNLVEVSSQHGKLQAPALISPGIAPDVVAMPTGQGHQNFTRYASGRGANPISILAPAKEPVTGSLAWAATRVKVTKLGKGELILFAGGLSERSEEIRHR